MLKHADIIDKLTTEEKASLLSEGHTLATDGWIAKGLNELEAAEYRDLRVKNGREYPDDSILINSWNRRAVRQAVADNTQNTVSGTLVLTEPLGVKVQPHGKGIAEDGFLVYDYLKTQLSTLKSCSLKPCLRASVLNKEDIKLLDKEPYERLIYEDLMKPVTAAKGSAEYIITNSNNYSGEYSHVNEDIIQPFIRQNVNEGGYVIDEVTDKFTAIKAIAANRILWNVDSRTVLKAHENYNALKKMVDKGESTYQELDEAISSGKAISMDAINAALDRLLDFVDITAKKGDLPERETIQEEITPLQATEESIVLLKNAGSILPIAPQSKVLIIGQAAISQTNGVQPFGDIVKHTKLTLLGECQGYDLRDVRNDELQAEALSLAKDADTVFFFIGGFGKKVQTAETSAKLTAYQMVLLQELQNINDNVVAILADNISVDMRFDRMVRGVIKANLDSKYSAEALLNVVLGKANPSGKLTYTLYDDTDEKFSGLRLRKNSGRVKIGQFYGYRNYTMPSNETVFSGNVRYPFGFGLSYTEFKYSKKSVTNGSVTLSVTNTGKRDGSEVLQCYYEKLNSSVLRPERTLIGYEKIFLRAGETKTVTINYDEKDLAVYEKGAYRIEYGEYMLHIGTSVLDTPVKIKTEVIGEPLERDGKELCDYLLSESNIIKRGYTLKPVIKQSSLPSIFLKSSLISAVSSALWFAMLIVMTISGGFIGKPVTEIAGVWVIWIILIILTVTIFFIGVGMLTMLRKRNKENYKKGSDYIIVDKQFPFEKLFEDAFAEVAEADNTDKPQASQGRADVSDFYDYSLTYPMLTERLEQFLVERGLSVDTRTLKELVAALSTSRLILIRTEQAALVKRFLELLAEFADSSLYTDDANIYNSPINMIQGVDDQQTNFASAIESATKNAHVIHTVYLENVRPENFDKYFMPFSKYIANAEETVVSLQGNTGLLSLTLTPNIWIVAVFGVTDNLSALDSYLSDLSVTLQVNPEVLPEKNEKTDIAKLNYYQLAKMYEDNRQRFILDEDLFWKKVDAIEKHVQNYIEYSISNKLWQNMEKFAAINIACGESAETVMDNVIADSLLLTVMNMLSVHGEVEDSHMSDTLQAIFGSEAVNKSIKLIADLSINSMV